MARSSLKVYIPRRGNTDPFVDALIPLLAAGVELRHEDHSGCSIIVSGVPAPEQIEGNEALKAVIIPYAGVPGRTRELLLKHSQIELHNLHHNNEPTGEMAVTLMLAAARWIVPVHNKLAQGDWRPRYADERPMLLSGRHCLVLGYGAIGRHVGRACIGLGMSVTGVRRTLGESIGEQGERIVGINHLEALLSQADVLQICLPNTPDTDGLLSAARLAQLPSHAIVVNTGRGALIDEEALYYALRRRAIGGAGLDVWYQYPREELERENTPPSRFDFGSLDNVVMSPHRGGHVDRSEELRAQHLARLLNAAGSGELMPNRIDLERGY